MARSFDTVFRAAVSGRFQVCFTRLVLGGAAGPNQGIRARLDGLGEFLQVLGDVKHVVQELIDIFRVHVERLVELAGQFGERPQRALQLG